jgi:hypothetical protein
MSDIDQITFPNLDELNNVILQLPTDAREHESGLWVLPQEDGSYILNYPKKWKDQITNADPNAQVVQLYADSLSPQQLVQGLMMEDKLTFEESRDFLASGSLPPLFQDVINNLPGDKRSTATLSIIARGAFRYDDYLVQLLFSKLGWDQNKSTQFFNDSVKL